jgi:hypothetical protein
MLQVLATISHKFCCRKEACGYAKVIQKKREKKRQVSKNRKRRTKATRLKKKERKKEEKNKIAHVLLQKFLSFKKRGMFSRNIVEFGLATISHTYCTHMHILI